MFDVKHEYNDVLKLFVDLSIGRYGDCHGCMHNLPRSEINDCLTRPLTSPQCWCHGGKCRSWRFWSPANPPQIPLGEALWAPVNHAFLVPGQGWIRTDERRRWIVNGSITVNCLLNQIHPCITFLYGNNIYY